MESIHTTTQKTPEQVKTEKIAALKSRIMAFKSSHPARNENGETIVYEELDALESKLAEETGT